MKFRNIIKNVEHFWRNPDKTNEQSYLKIFVSSIKSFIDDKCFDKAAMLTFYSLLSIVPLIAIGFGISQEFGLAEKFSNQIKETLQSQPEVANKIIEFSNSMLKTTRGGIIAGFGIVLLLWTVFRMIGNIATFFNEIWRVKKSPSLLQQAKSYIPMIILFPLFIVGSSSAIIYMSSKALLAIHSIKFLETFGPFLKILIHLISLLISWSLLSFFYIFLPNTKVSWKAAIIAGIFTGIVYGIWQWIYVTFQMKAASYGAVYGSFAAVPLFLLWLNYSWLIILFGTELTYHIQKFKTKN